MPANVLEIELFGNRNDSTRGMAGDTPIAGKARDGGNGSLLLNEITAMPSLCRRNLLQVLRERRVVLRGIDSRYSNRCTVFAASSDKLDRALAEKRLREELYHA